MRNQHPTPPRSRSQFAAKPRIYKTKGMLPSFLMLPFCSACGLAASIAGHVESWGYNSYGQTNPPAGLDGVTAVAGGSECSLALLTNGTVVGWGNNDIGQANPPSGLSGVIAIAASNLQRHSLALKSDGTVVGWGNNFQGQLNIPAGLIDAMAIAAGGSHSLAVRSNGTVVAWGSNSNGQTNVPPGLSEVIAVAEGADYSLALKQNGTVVGWGNLNNPNLNIPSGLTGVVAIVTSQHTLALKNDGSVVAWGLNDAGQANVPTGLSGVMAIAAGVSHSLVLRSDGTPVAWGFNRDGQGTVPAGLSGVTAISAGGNHNLVITRRPLISFISPVVVTNVGATVTFAVSISGEQLVFQWRHDDADVPGETNSSIILTNVQIGDRGVYRVLVSNPYGSVLSPLTSISFPAPRILSQPESQTRYRGDTATFNVTADGLVPLSHQWRKGGVDLSGASAPSLTVPNLRTNDAGIYQVMILDVTGNSVTSVVATLTIIDPTANRSLAVTPASDTGIYSSGGDPQGLATILAGTRNNGIMDRGLLRFDLSSLPSAAVLRSVRLRLNVVKVPFRPANSSFGLYRMIKPWGADTTWSEATAGLAWAAPGGMAGVDYAGSSSAIQFIAGGGSYDLGPSDQLIADLDVWRKATTMNQGWLLKTESEGTLGTARHFSASDSAQPPQLFIEYEIPPPPPRVTSTEIQGGNLLFRFDGTPGWIYRVESRDDVDHGPWTTVTNAPAGSSGNAILISVARTTTRRFYRVVAE